MNLTPQQLRERDAWIAEHVMGWVIYKTVDDWMNAGSPIGRKITILEEKNHSFEIPHHTTDPAASDALDDAILRKLNGYAYRIYFQGGLYVMRSLAPDGICVEHPDKKICRVLFAQKLFNTKEGR